MSFARKYPDFPEMPHDATPGMQALYYRMSEWWAQTKLTLSERDQKVFEGSAGKEPWGITGVSVIHKIDVTSATDTYTANRLGVLLQDLKAKGIIS